jgi:lysophospholipase
MNQNVNYTVDYTAGPSGNQSEFIGGIFENVGAKAEAGFPISVTDAFGQFWANYIPEDWMFKNYSEIASDGSVFSEGDGPMPIIVLTEVIPGQSPEIGNIMYPGNNATNGFNITSYEVTPLEFGSWAGGRIQAFIPTEYLGTTMSNGSAANSSECARGFDKFTFIQGSTANAYPAWFIDAFYDIPIFAKRGLEARQDDNSNDIPIPPDQEGNPLVQLVNGTAENFNQTFNESMWATYPNPFQGYNEAMANVDELLLVSRLSSNSKEASLTVLL